MTNIPQEDRCTAEQVAYSAGYQAAKKAKVTGKHDEKNPYSSQCMIQSWDKGYNAFYNDTHIEIDDIEDDETEYFNFLISKPSC